MASWDEGAAVVCCEVMIARHWTVDFVVPKAAVISVETPRFLVESVLYDFVNDYLVDIR